MGTPLQDSNNQKIDIAAETVVSTILSLHGSGDLVERHYGGNSRQRIINLLTSEFFFTNEDAIYWLDWFDFH